MDQSHHAESQTPMVTRRNLIKFGALALAASSVLGACGDDEETPGDGAAEDDPAAESGARPEGIDVSEFSGEIDWPQVLASGVQFAYVKATQGATIVDARFASNRSGARAAGLRYGAYHFFEADTDSAAQARHFLATVGEDIGSLPPVLDVETGMPSRAEVQAWLDLVEEQTGVTPVIYSTAPFANEHLSGFGSYPLWIADYGASTPTLPVTWTTWTVWQYDDSANVPGIDGVVDANVHNGPLP